MKETEFKKKAFGELEKFVPTKKILGKPLKSGALKIFCTSCGSYLEFKHEVVESLKDFLDYFPTDPENYFLEVTSCINCTASKKKSKFRKISELD